MDSVHTSSLGAGSSSAPALDTPLEQVIFAVVDVESTGGSLERGDRICEVAIVRAQNGAILDRWSTLIQPGHPMNSIVAAKTGIRDSMLRAAPRFAAVAAAVQERFSDAVLVAHGASFDTRFLRFELAQAGDPPYPFPSFVLDTLRLAQTQYSWPSYKLTDLGTSLALPVSPTAHRALPDAVLTWEILWHIIGDLRDRGAPLRTLGDLLSAQTTPIRRVPTPTVAARIARWEQTAHWDRKQQLAELLMTWLQSWSQAPAQIERPLEDEAGVADVCFTYPMGWRLVHQMLHTPITTQELTARTHRFHASGADVVWWLGDAANTPANQQWCRSYQGWRGEVTGDLRPTFQLHQDVYGYERPIETTPDNTYTRYWRELALVRYLELWQRIRTADFLRGLEGTPLLGRSVTGIIGAANIRHTLQKRRDQWYPLSLTPFYPARVPPWTAAAVAAGRARARQYRSAEGQVRGA